MSSQRQHKGTIFSRRITIGVAGEDRQAQVALVVRTLSLAETVAEYPEYFSTDGYSSKMRVVNLLGEDAEILLKLEDVLD
ncbi:MAG: hypothetical protein ACFB21_11265 [Opitutales bacterium]